MPITLGILAQSRQAVAASDFVLLDSRVLTSAEASVTFSSLGSYSGTYKHLQIRSVARTTRAVTEDGAPRMFLNADTTLTNYRSHYLVGTGSSVVSYDNGQILGLGSYPGNNAGADQFLPQVFDILDPFNSSKNTTVRMLAGITGSVTSIRLASGVWFNTASLTSIEIAASSSNWAIGSRFALYGVK